MIEFQVDLEGDRHISTAYGTIGRGTAVLPIVPGGSAAVHFGRDRLVAKMACPLVSRPAEDRLIRVIRRKMNKDEDGRQYLKHIVDLKCSYSCEMDDLELPRIAMGPVSEGLRRCFRVLIMPEYFPLERIKGPADLQKIFRDVIKGEHLKEFPRFFQYLTTIIRRSSLGVGDLSYPSSGHKLREHHVLP